MEYSQYYQAKKPALDDLVLVGDLNETTDLFDAELHRLSEGLAVLLARIAPLEGLVGKHERQIAENVAVLGNHEGRITALENALFNDVTGNPWKVEFDTLTGVLVEGVWNQAKRRIEF